jgi:N-acetylmuramoyl-L-alanine amidase
MHCSCRRLVVITIRGQWLYLALIIFVLGFGLWMLLEPAIWTNLPWSTLISGKKVVIDAGHGGGDPGAKSLTGVSEKDINLDVALKLKKYLSRVGVYCVMTREIDQDFFNATILAASKKQRDLMYRTRVANKSRAELFLSIHANSFPQTIYHGAQTFFNPHNQQSRRLAQAIQYYMIKNLGPNRRRPKPGDFRVLNDIKMPGVMIETGFLSNPEEAALLNNPQYRDRIAVAIYHGVIAYLSNQVDKFGEDKVGP